MAENTKLVAAADLRSKWNKDQFIEGLKFVKHLTGIEELKEEQEKALRSFIKERICILVLLQDTASHLYFFSSTSFDR